MIHLSKVESWKAAEQLLSLLMMTKAFPNGNEDFPFFVKSLKMEGSSLVWHILRKYNFTWIDFSTFKKLIYISWAGIVKKLYREGSVWSCSLDSVIWNFAGCSLSIFGEPVHGGRVGFPITWLQKCHQRISLTLACDSDLHLIWWERCKYWRNTSKE